MGFGENMRERRLALDMTQSELGGKVGCGKSTINRYESGEINVPYERILTIAKALSTSPAALMGWSDESSQQDAGVAISAQARRIATLYDLADERDRKVIDIMLQKYETRLPRAIPLTASEKPIAQPHCKMRRDGFEELDVYDQPSAAGFGNYLDVPVSQKQQYPAGIVPAATSFGILISGDSMEPKIHNRSTAFVQAVPAIDHGGIGIFVLNGQSYCKQLIIDRKKREVRLHSLNSRYDDIVIGEHDELRTIGRVLGSYPK